MSQQASLPDDDNWLLEDTDGDEAGRPSEVRKPGKC